MKDTRYPLAPSVLQGIRKEAASLLVRGFMRWDGGVWLWEFLSDLFDELVQGEPQAPSRIEEMLSMARHMGLEAVVG